MPLSPQTSTVLQTPPAPPPTLTTFLPDADIVTTGWATAPLFSKINDDSDATVITATAS